MFITIPNQQLDDLRSNPLGVLRRSCHSQKSARGAEWKEVCRVKLRKVLEKTWKTWAGGMNLMYIDNILIYLARFLDNV